MREAYPIEIGSNIDTLCVIDASKGFAHPLYFDSHGKRLFAWLHQPPNSQRSDIGVVICAPFGYESICSHRGVREFAETFAAAGIPALRFDYVGSGDSADCDADADILRLWSQNALAAVEELRRRTGVERVCLLGIRLGALIATLAARESGKIDALIAIAPVVSGRKYVREMRMTQLAGIAMSGGTEPAPKGLEAGGFTLSAASVESLGLVDLQNAPAPPVRSMLILDSDKLPTAKRWAEILGSTAIDLQYQTLPGLIEMAMTAPQFAVSPRMMIDAARQWLLDLSGPAVPASVAGTLGESTLPLYESHESPQSAIVERPVFIAARSTLFGIVTEPRTAEGRRRAVILLNAGADFHIGASRMYVSLARRWARRGYFVLRLDLGGIGDSATRPDSVYDDVFPEHAIDDIRCAIEFIRSRYAIVDMSLAGLCSGAYHALRAAVAGVAINRILLVNPQNYFWDKGMTLEQLQLAEVVNNPGIYRERVLSLQAWRRFFTGQINIARIGLVYLQGLRLAAEAVLRNSARRLRIRLPHDLGWELKKIVADGVRISFVFASGEPGLALLKLQAGSTAWQLGDKCCVKIIECGDHIFSRRGPRSIMEDVLSYELFTRADDVESVSVTPAGNKTSTAAASDSSETTHCASIHRV